MRVFFETHWIAEKFDNFSLVRFPFLKQSSHRMYDEWLTWFHLFYFIGLFVKQIGNALTTLLCTYSAKHWLAILDNVDQDLVEKIRNKTLKINLENGTRSEVYEYKAFWCKKKCYIWDVTKNVFSRLVGFDNGTMYSDFHLGDNHGLSKEEQLLRWDASSSLILIRINWYLWKK